MSCRDVLGDKINKLQHCCGLLKCKWRGLYKESLSAPHPFREGKTIRGCPECGTIGIYVACEANGCSDPGTTRYKPGEAICAGPFYCDYHWGKLNNPEQYADDDD